MPIAKGLRLACELLPVRGWDRIFRLAFDPAQQPDFEFEIPLFEGTFVGHANNWVDWYALFHGCYEPADVQLMRNLLSKMNSPVVLDIGANVGHHSVALAGLAGEVHAFEPYPPRIEHLRKNVARNPQLHITAHPVALGNENGNANFRLPVGGQWAGVQFDISGPLSFPIRNGDDYLKTNGIERVDFIKLDVDGNEIDVLRGLSHCIKAHRPVIVMEVNEHVERPPQQVLPEGYRISVSGGSENVLFIPNERGTLAQAV